MTNIARTASTQLQPLIDPQIIFEDPHLIVLSKPAGLLSQGEHRGEENLVDWLRAYLGRPYVGLIHRLDRNTSGLMVVAKRSKSAERLTRFLQNGDVQRVYLGWVSGTLTHEVHWAHQLQKESRTNTVHVVSSGGKEASLNAVPVDYGIWNQVPLTLVQFKLETGRSHQIRVQAAYEGFPLVGDKKYGTSQITSSFSRVALHSFQLKFPHPMSKEILSFEVPLPKDLNELRK